MQNYRNARFGAAAIAVCLGLGLSACSSGGGDDNVNIGNNDNAGLPALTQDQIYAADGELSARIQTTTGGVPHITADDLESVAFGSGYVQARDNVCIIADSIIRATGERARYYGRGPGNRNIVTDFSYKALHLLDKANEQFDKLSDPSQAMFRGFVAGYNKYVRETEPTALPAKCNQAPWVREITPQQLYAYYQMVALYASGDQFVTGVTFSAVPPSASTRPTTARHDTAAREMLAAMPDFDALAQNGKPSDLGLKTDFNDRGMASNGWGIGGDMTENSRGALLANPHFPYTGNRRLYQMQLTVPGVYNVNGAGLIGIVIPLIGFNENVAWTHTVSTAQHFTLYDLTLKSGDDMTYIKDGQEKPIQSETFSIQVATGPASTTEFQRTFYYSEYGPMIAANLINDQLPSWGENFAGRPTAFTYRDANAETARRVIDQWLNMGRARNLAEFKRPFQACGSVLWVNTLYADDSGQAFYIDGTAVPNLSSGALTAYRARINTNPFVRALAARNITLLDGSRGVNDWVPGACDGRVAYDGLPKLARRDYVQNSNDSFWATNPAQPLTGYSPLFGSTRTPLSPRTRMGLAMLQNPTDPGLSQIAPAGSDGKFTGEEIINALYSNRAYYAETLLDDLRARCETAGDTTIETGDGNDRSVDEGCTALTNWNGVYDIDSTGAQVFRVFIADYRPAEQGRFTVPFDPDNPATTPRTPAPPADDIAQDPMLISLARGLNRLADAGIAVDAALGEVQRAQQSTGTSPFAPAAPTEPQGLIAWHGNQNVEGGFNIVRPAEDNAQYEDGTRYPRYAPPTIDNTGDLSSNDGEGWLVAYGTSWHFGLSFTEAGPQGYGLLSYSQSDDPGSEHYTDQDQRYSAKRYRKLLYRQAEITADDNLETETIDATVEPGGAS